MGLELEPEAGAGEEDTMSKARHSWCTPHADWHGSYQGQGGETYYIETCAVCGAIRRQAARPGARWRIVEGSTDDSAPCAVRGPQR